MDLGTTPRLINYLPSHAWIAQRTLVGHDAPRPLVVHDHACLVYYRGGEARFWMGQTYSLREGCVLIVPAGVPHRALEANAPATLALSLCPHCTPVAELNALFGRVMRGACAVRVLDARGGERFASAFERVADELSANRAAQGLALQGAVYMLTAELLRASEAEGQGASPSLVADALAFVHEHGCEGISLREVAAHVGRTPAHVASLVRKATGETVGGWITRARMSQSRRLLLHTDATIEQVASHSGFASPSHFSRVFKRAHGVAPGAWRTQTRPPSERT